MRSKPNAPILRYPNTDLDYMIWAAATVRIVMRG